MHDITEKSMNSSQKKRLKIEASRVVSTVSVSLVLITLGIVALTAVLAHNVAHRMESSLGYVVLIKEGATDQSKQQLIKWMKSTAGIKHATYVSADAVNARWKKQIGDDELGDVNPFLDEIDVQVRDGWHNADSLGAMAAKLSKLESVEEVKIHSDLAREVNRTVRTSMILLSAVAAVLLLISFVLINNTVGMEIYSQRMVIHTMQYVGARNSFIRRPYLWRSMLSGIVAGIIAWGVLGVLLWWVGTINIDVAETIGWQWLCIVGACLIGVGAMLCSLASVMATNKYLRRSYDQLFN